MKRTRIKAVQDCLSRAECILQDCSEPMVRRGLCSHHYSQFDYQRRSKEAAEDKEKFEQKMVREGLVLEAYQQRSWRKSNPFL